MVGGFLPILISRPTCVKVELGFDNEYIKDKDKLNKYLKVLGYIFSLHDTVYSDVRNLSLHPPTQNHPMHNLWHSLFLALRFYKEYNRF